MKAKKEAKSAAARERQRRKGRKQREIDAKKSEHWKTYGKSYGQMTKRDFIELQKRRDEELYNAALSGNIEFFHNTLMKGK